MVRNFIRFIKMKNQHDLDFGCEFEMNDSETVEKRDGNENWENHGCPDPTKNPKNSGLEIDGLIVNNQLYQFQQAVDGKVMFTLVENTECRTESGFPGPVKKRPENEPIKLPEIRNDLPVDESIRPGPRPKRTDSQLSKRELDRRNRRRAINRDCARRARKRRQQNDFDLETRLEHLEQENTSWKRKYSDLQEKILIYETLLKSTSAQGMELLK